MKYLLGITAVLVVLGVCTALDLANMMKFGNHAVPNNRLKRAHDETFIAFSAGLTAMVNVSANATIAFDKVFINSGNGYNNSTGVFTCHHDGVYVFLYHGLSESAGSLWMDLYKNGVYQITGYAHNENEYAAASNAILLQLVENDTVYIRGHGTNQLYGKPDETYATFSGFILIPQGQGHGENGGNN
ncbi:hypothetical protein DPMN_182117 [Dreissena polymorpha]|uniref:C1q domain-containing protein n=2 Tax=Dreissena polymorpha TaxID=45954 RepID=A0A9D4DF84_DREPO|nr:hypothetical protein DPMN_182117 [Dreissena polymorpha]